MGEAEGLVVCAAAPFQRAPFQPPARLTMLGHQLQHWA
eukprot:CAMPEP_0170407990 /NCGR_PEP_ID=MMETSP0117_2-20130122/28549_1 /TAXON_ID=400756 /ORGANISM="Durinskia baltica, Strain CSIRO CS-38" /LENGTH=37 /DNA_ID= /DNA_START= /DNA_END= /DNA_ORIENTATION=